MLRGTAAFCLFFVSLPAWSDASRARNLQEKFIAPCCWSEPVSVHRSPAATEMRAEIDRMIAAGKTDDEIVSFYTAQHGERILAVPRGQRSVWLIITPFVALALAGAWLIRYLLRRRTAQPELAHAGPGATVRDEDIDW